MNTTPATGSISPSSIIQIGDNIVQAVTDHEGLINTIAGLAGILPEVSLAEKALPIITLILQFLEQESGQAPLQVFQDFISHITPGKPGAPALEELPSGS